MKQRYDLLAFALLSFSVVVLACFAEDPKGFALKDWQTLIAAMVALGAATMAYKSAMAKVEVDREEHRREFLRRQLAQYLKLELAIRRFQPPVRALEGVIMFRTADEEPIAVRDLRLKEPPEIEEAWGNLDVFPRKLIREIASIRACIREIDDLLQRLPDERELRSGRKHETTLDLVLGKVSAVGEACAIILDGLEPEIERLAPMIPENERILTIYGQPDFGD